MFQSKRIDLEIFREDNVHPRDRHFLLDGITSCLKGMISHARNGEVFKLNHKSDLVSNFSESKFQCTILENDLDKRGGFYKHWFLVMF